MKIDQSTIESAIIENATRSFLNDDELYARVEKSIEARIDRLFAEKVSEIIDEAAKVAFSDALDREYCRVDSFGRPVGELTTVSKEIERMLSDYWTENVSRDGKPSSAYGSLPRAQWMMGQICADDFSKEMKQHVVNVGGQLKDQFRFVLDQHVSSILDSVFRVRSAGDQAKK